MPLLLRQLYSRTNHIKSTSTTLRSTQPRPFTTSQTTKMRVPYAPTTPPTPEDAPIYERIAARRHPRPLIPLDLALLHNTAIADGWNAFIGAIRTKTSLSAAYKELAISRIAVLNHAVHEWDVHGALAVKAGVSKEGLQTAFVAPVFSKGDSLEKLLEGTEGGKAGLSREEWIVLAYTDQMTRGVEVDEKVSEAVKGVLEEKEVVELTATVAAYNCVSRFLVALDVGECNGRAMKKVEDM